MESMNVVVYMLIGSAAYKILQHLKKKNEMGFAFLIPIVISFLITAENFVLYKGSAETLTAYAGSFLFMAFIIEVPVTAYVVYVKTKVKSLSK